MRPKSIVLFERVYLLSIVVSIVAIALGWNQVSAMAAAQSGLPAGAQQGVLIGAVVFAFLVPLLLLYFIARRASNVAKWIFVALTAYSLLSSLLALARPEAAKDLLFVLNAIAVVLTLYCAWLLFRPDAKAWLESKGADAPADPTAFD